MVKENSTFEDIEIEYFSAIKVLFFKKIWILRKYYYLTRFLLVKATINSLLVT